MDYYETYLNRQNIDWNRFIPSLVNILYLNIQDFLKVHPQDFYCGIGAFIKAILFSAICYVLTMSFFITDKFKKKILAKKECLFIIALTFLLYAIPFNDIHNFNVYLKSINNLVVFIQYQFPIFFYIIFFWAFIKIIILGDEVNKLYKIFILLNAFLLGAWIEIYNIATLFSTLILIILLLIFDRKKLWTKNIILFLVPFIFGFFTFFILSDYISGKEIAGYSFSSDYNGLINSIRNSIFDFNLEYFNWMFLKKCCFYLLIIFLSIPLLLKKDKCINNILLTCFSILAGYLVMNYLFIFLINIVPYEKYMVKYSFQRDLYDCIYTNILEYIIIVLLGCFYFQCRILRNIILFVIAFIIAMLFSIIYPSYTQFQNFKQHTRLLAYKIDKMHLIYDQFDEPAVLPASLINEYAVIENRIFPFDSRFGYKNIKDRGNLLKNRFFDSLYVFYHTYYEAEYKKKYNGAIFRDDNIALKEYEQRLEIINEKPETDEEIIKNKIKFKGLLKYRNTKLSLKDVKSDNENKNLILKLKANEAYSIGNIQTAVSFYNEYLKNNKDDIDVLYKLAKLYFENKMIKESEQAYTKLNYLDKNNLTFLYNLLYINYFIKKDYNKSLKICDIMIDTQPNMYILYLNKAVVLNKLQDKDELKILINEALEKTNILINQNKIGEEIEKPKFVNENY